MVQVGAKKDPHPVIPGAINLLGKTSLRQLMALIYHSEGVACIVTCLMHIAAAFNKPCVVLAGGREHYWWEAYTKHNRRVNMVRADPNWQEPIDDDFIPHRYIHTHGAIDSNIGTLPCCEKLGCWRGRIGPPPPPGEKYTVCLKQVTKGKDTPLPLCMDMITPELVIKEIMSYYEDGTLLLPKHNTWVPVEERETSLQFKLKKAMNSSTVLGSPIFLKEKKGTEDPNEIPTEWYTRNGKPLALYAEALPEFKNRYPKYFNLVQGKSRWELAEECLGETTYFIWMRYPFRPRNTAWMESLYFPSHVPTAYGVIRWTFLTKEMERAIIGAKWYRARPFEKHPMDHEKNIVYYLDKNVSCLPTTAAARKPAQLPGMSDEIAEGARLYQEGFAFIDIGDSLKGH